MGGMISVGAGGDVSVTGVGASLVLSIDETDIEQFI